MLVLLALTLTGCSSAELNRAATVLSQVATAAVTVTPVNTVITVVPPTTPTASTIRTAVPTVTAQEATATNAPLPTAVARPTSKPSVTPQPSATPLPRTINGLRVVSAASLPREARQTLALIDSNGPFPYRQDGVVFQNREGILPRKASGYYHEYTVVTPGSRDRGARRIVLGNQGEYYYTSDHYSSFVRVIR